MRESEIPWWLRNDLEIIGFEEDDDEGDEDEDENEDSENEDENSEDQEEDEDEDEDDPQTEGLKSALRKERRARKEAERELKKLQKAAKPPKKEENSEDEDDSSKKEDEAKSERLAKKLRDNTIDTAILKFTEDFRDQDAVLRLIDRGEIEVDQDDDDPSEIEVDEDSVKAAVKQLRKKYPYLMKSEEERVRSGSKFGGKKTKNSAPSDDALRAKYAGLRR